jgi:hypothetical protein
MFAIFQIQQGMRAHLTSFPTNGMQEKHGIAPQLAAKSSSSQSIEPLIGFVEKSDEWDGDMHKKTRVAN